jgi:hypothetical protein
MKAKKTIKELTDIVNIARDKAHAAIGSTKDPATEEMLDAVTFCITTYIVSHPIAFAGCPETAHFRAAYTSMMSHGLLYDFFMANIYDDTAADVLDGNGPRAMHLYDTWLNLVANMCEIADDELMTRRLKSGLLDLDSLRRDLPELFRPETDGGYMKIIDVPDFPDGGSHDL